MQIIIWQLVLQLVLIFLNAIFACAEIAVISLSDLRISQLAAAGNKKAVKLQKLTEQPSGFLATIQIAITLSGFLGSAFAAENFSDYLVNWVVGLGVDMIPPETLNSIAVVLITLLLSFLTLVFGELVPKRLAMKKTETLALAMASPVYAISRLFSPLVALLTGSTNLVLRMFGVDPSVEEEDVSKESIQMMVDAATEQDVLDDDEKEIIQNLFEFDDLTVGEFATHRTEIALLWKEESVEEWDQTIHDSRHTCFPVCDETVDDIIGILNAKDYFRLSNRTKEEIMEKAVQPAYFVPSTVRADVMFRQMKQSRKHFAVVLDEYGGTLGIVTMNDLLEQLVGDLDDNASAPQEPDDIQQLDSGTWRINGAAPLTDVAEHLETELPTEEYETFGGLVFGLYGSVPDDGTTFEIDIENLHIKVTEIRDHRLETAIVCLIEKEPDASDTEGEK